MMNQSSGVRILGSSHLILASIDDPSYFPPVMLHLLAATALLPLQVPSGRPTQSHRWGQARHPPRRRKPSRSEPRPNPHLGADKSSRFIYRFCFQLKRLFWCSHTNQAFAVDFGGYPVDNNCCGKWKTKNRLTTKPATAIVGNCKLRLQIASQKVTNGIIHTKQLTNGEANRGAHGQMRCQGDVPDANGITIPMG